MDQSSELLHPGYRHFATPRDLEYLDALAGTGSMRKAAELLGVTRQSVQKKLKALKRRAAKQGFSPDIDWTNPVPEPHIAKGISDFRQWKDEDGNTRMQWVKSSVREDHLLQMAREMLDAMRESIPSVEPTPAPKIGHLPQLLNCYVITDYHIGMMAWGEETRGPDWDATIAEDLLTDWFTTALLLAPEAHTGLFCQLGDFLHWDGLEAVTPTSKHVLDADTRFQKVVRIAIRVCLRVISALLQKHTHVIVLMAEGNHDIASSAWLREWMSAYYQNDPRVTVITDADPYYCVEWGKTGLYFHHGHKRGVKDLDSVFTRKFRDVYGRTEFSYGHCGHLHHTEKESRLMLIERHQTLAAMDAHASRGGWLSERSAQVITYDKRFGEVGRVRLTPDMVKSFRRSDND